MKKNIGATDRYIRIALAVILIALSAADVLTGIWTLAGFIAAGILLLTSLVSSCPLYLPFGIRTNRAHKLR
ncbi:YgaP family membrane protein [Arsenicibacter rosenii]|uniref:Inner membrane protein YgaP-like transmembrane domain-containing protein n=1 Tax=Arsenicibacter rosenii TaxID=1750698 RepID=A0A1S2VHU5_9BACT|nr:DUF2892 domain-containing protein [Arsenicibacter rosenii]OIN58321.1 hypothetical protein BLX24_15110 [Arsenicibacter rosenii]